MPRKSYDKILYNIKFTSYHSRYLHLNSRGSTIEANNILNVAKSVTLSN